MCGWLVTAGYQWISNTSVPFLIMQGYWNQHLAAINVQFCCPIYTTDCICNAVSVMSNDQSKKSHYLQFKLKLLIGETFHPRI